MLSIHPDARTTPAVRADIARSAEPTGVVAARYEVSTETIRRWRKRRPDACQDRSTRLTSSTRSLVPLHGGIDRLGSG